jgi:hypothetical protein
MLFGDVLGDGSDEFLGSEGAFLAQRFPGVATAHRDRAWNTRAQTMAAGEL